jgi:CRP-like cAMP-binding protein
MDLIHVMRKVELFEGLSEQDLEDILGICLERRYKKNDYLTVEGDPGEDLFIIIEGMVEVLVKGKEAKPRVLVNLGEGQLIGEMSLVDQGSRSATVRVTDESTVVLAIRHQEFQQLCRMNYRIGYIVMKNLAADLSFKLRQRHLSGA